MLRLNALWEDVYQNQAKYAVVSISENYLKNVGLHMTWILLQQENLNKISIFFTSSHG